MTRAPGMLMVLMRPPSLDPSSPDVREPREWTIRRSGYRLAGLERRKDRIDRRFVAQPAGVQDHVVVGRVVAVVAVNLLDIRGPVLVGLLHPLARLLFGGQVEAGHDRPHAHSLRGAEEHVQGAGKLAQDVGAAAPDDHHVAAADGLLDHTLRDPEDRLPGLERWGDVWPV